MVSKPKLIFPKGSIKLLKQDYNGTLFEGITDEIKTEEGLQYKNILTEFDFTTVFDLSEDMNAELRSELINSESISVADVYNYIRFLFDKIALRIENNFDSDEELIEYVNENNFTYILTEDTIERLTDWCDAEGERLKILFNINQEFDIKFAEGLYLKARMAEAALDKLYWEDEPSVGDYFEYEYMSLSDDEHHGEKYQVIGRLTEEDTEIIEVKGNEDGEMELQNSAFEYEIIEYDDEIDTLSTQVGVIEKAGETLITCDDESMFTFTSEKPE